jgi:penicillin-binding protein 1A
VRPLLLLIRFVAIVVVGSVFLATGAVVVTPRVVDFVSANSSTPKEISIDKLAATSLVFDAGGGYLGQLKGEINRKPVKLENISPKAVKSVLAVEDNDFYEHNGVNARAITRALLRNVSAGGVQQGGSTITQQLVRLSVLDDASRDFLNRKVPEAVLALRIEEKMTKDEILEAYLNTVYFGGGAYGIQAAAETYFNKFSGDLDWPESALLASMINNPNRNDPTINPERAIQQRSLALKRLAETKNITEEQRREYELVKLPDRRFEPVAPRDKLEDGYFLEEVKQSLLDEPALGKTFEERRDALFTGGLRIYTTIDPKAQFAAEAAIRNTLPGDDRDFTAALAAIEPGTGAIRAMVGGPGFDRLEFNIATSKGRQTGSSFKPFVLAAAMEQGFIPQDTLDGTGQCVFDNKGAPDPIYVAENFNGDPGGFGSIEQLTLRSSNCGYLRLGQVVGISNVIATARGLGLKADLQNVLSLPLGVVDVTPLDMAAAYNAFANDGKRAEPYYVSRVEDPTGKVIFEHKPQITRGISTQSAREVTQVLEANVRSGTGTRARLGDQPAAGKTGTTSDFTDAWFVGYTPYLTTAVWMGNAEAPVEMRNVGGLSSVTGGTFPAQMWGAFNRDYHQDKPVKPFNPPEPPGRGGRDLRTYSQLSRAGNCGDQPLTVDTDGDGRVDTCVPPTTTTVPTTTAPGSPTTTAPGTPTTSAPRTSR